MSGAIRVHYLEDGDHSFKPRVRSGRTNDQNLDKGLEADGWSMNQALSIPGGRIVEYLKQGKTLQVVAGGKPGALSIHMELDAP